MNTVILYVDDLMTRSRSEEVAGFTRVLARRALVKQLPGILAPAPSARS